MYTINRIYGSSEIYFNRLFPRQRVHEFLEPDVPPFKRLLRFLFVVVRLGVAAAISALIR